MAKSTRKSTVDALVSSKQQQNAKSIIKKSRKVMVTKTLDRISELVPAGYTHDSFMELSRLVRDVATNLTLDELKSLESSCRDSYTDNLNSEEFETLISDIKSRFE